MNIDRAIELLTKARKQYGGDRDMIITVEELDSLLKSLNRRECERWREPRLQRVTPEAIAELEGKEIRTICVLSQGDAKTMTWNTRIRQWHWRAGHDNPLEWQWFIDLSTIPEVAQ